MRWHSLAFAGSWWTAWIHVTVGINNEGVCITPVGWCSKWTSSWHGRVGTLSLYWFLYSLHTSTGPWPETGTQLCTDHLGAVLKVIAALNLTKIVRFEQIKSKIFSVWIGQSAQKRLTALFIGDVTPSSLAPKSSLVRHQLLSTVQGWKERTCWDFNLIWNGITTAYWEPGLLSLIPSTQRLT